MNTKEAIEFLEDLQRNIITNIDEMQGCDKVIELLQRGKKYEVIVKKIKYELDTPKSILINGEDVKNRIEQLEQRNI